MLCLRLQCWRLSRFRARTLVGCAEISCRSWARHDAGHLSVLNMCLAFDDPQELMSKFSLRIDPDQLVSP